MDPTTQSATTATRIGAPSPEGPPAEREGAQARTDIASRCGPAAPLVRFLLHAIEMGVAMMLGMALLLPLYQLAMRALGYPSPNEQLPELSALAAAVCMTLPMVGWMLFRGMGRRCALEMGSAMVLPTVGLVALSAVGIVPRDALVHLTHCLSSQFMWLVMVIRWRQFAYPRHP